MKLAIEKVKETGQVRIELTTPGQTKPSVVLLTPEQLELLLSVLRTARNADVFRFVLEV